MIISHVVIDTIRFQRCAVSATLWVYMCGLEVFGALVIMLIHIFDFFMSILYMMSAAGCSRNYKNLMRAMLGLWAISVLIVYPSCFIEALFSANTSGKHAEWAGLLTSIGLFWFFHIHWLVLGFRFTRRLHKLSVTKAN